MGCSPEFIPDGDPRLFVTFDRDSHDRAMDFAKAWIEAEARYQAEARRQWSFWTNHPWARRRMKGGPR
jgi:hypothetical protein